MFKNFLNKVKENEEKLKNRADVLFDKTKEKKNTNKTTNKNYSKELGSKTDNELSILNDKKFWGTNEREKSTSKPHTTKENKEQTPKKEEKDYSKVADLMYPTMKKKESDTLLKPKKDEETSIDKLIQKENKNADKDIKKILEIEREETKNRTKNFNLKDLDLDENEYEMLGDTISPKKKEKEFDEIDNIRYPNNTGNKKVEELKQQAKENRSKRLREDNTEYLKNNALLEQLGTDYVDNFFVKFGDKLISKAEEGVENLHLSKTKSYLDTPYAKEHKLFNSYEEAPNDLKNYFKDKITGQIGKDKLDKTKGLYIDANSKSSQSLKENLLKDDDFIDKLKNFDKALSNNYQINNSLKLKGKNWSKALGNADIRDMHINKNGDVELHITDVYDFNEGEKSNLVRIGKDRQDKGEITPYFIAYRVIIPKEEKEKILKEYGKRKNDNDRK